MLISPAFAQDVAGAVEGAPADPAIFNIGLILILFFLFYFLLIRPQNKRMKEQRSMLDSLQKGDTVVTAGGFIGTIASLQDDNKVEIELAKGVKVMALRYSIHEKVEDVKAPANDTKAEKKLAAKKTTAAKKKTAKKAPAKKSTAKKTTTKKTATKAADKKSA